MNYKFDIDKYYIAKRGDKYFNGELNKGLMLSGEFDTINWYAKTEYENECIKLVPQEQLDV